MKFRYMMAILVGVQVWVSSCFNANKISSVKQNIVEKKSEASFYNLKAQTIEGKNISMSDYKGKKIIILNTASECGYTPQYADWQKYYSKNKDKVVVLGFPCNQFLGQEPGNEKEIATFCQLNYGITFPMFKKVDVKGSDQHSIYQWLSNPEKNGWCSDVPTWNFCKYLIDENGNLTHFFASKITPDNEEFIRAIQ
ncbi:MAG: glutathione peroxidase [Saprospiraceae bacterium]